VIWLGFLLGAFAGFAVTYAIGAWVLRRNGRRLLLRINLYAPASDFLKDLLARTPGPGRPW